MDFYQDNEIHNLILLCREHNDEAFDELVRRYTPMIRKVIFSFDQVFYDFSELFSEGCVALHTAAQRFDTEQSEVTFGLFARICVRNRIVDLLRLSGGDRNVYDCDIEMMAEDDSPEGKLVERETFDSIINCAKHVLSDYEFKVLLLHIQGYKTAAIAKMLDRTAKSVDNAKSRLFRRLREELGSISDY